MSERLSNLVKVVMAAVLQVPLHGHADGTVPIPSGPLYIGNHWCQTGSSYAEAAEAERRYYEAHSGKCSDGSSPTYSLGEEVWWPSIGQQYTCGVLTALDSGAQRYGIWSTKCPGSPSGLVRVQETTAVKLGSLECPPNSYRSALEGTCTCKKGFSASGQILGVGACPPVVESDQTSPPPRHCPAASNPGVGNPIYPLRGTKREVVDLGLDLGGERLRLAYDTKRRAPLVVAGTDLADTELPSFGDLWSSSFHRRLVVGAAAKGARVARGDGTIVSFTGNGAGTYTGPTYVDDRLSSLTSGYLYIDAASLAMETYDANGRLSHVTRVDGRTMDFTYSDATTPMSVAPAAGYLIGVQNNFGRSVQFQYAVPVGGEPTTDGRVIRIIDPLGQDIAATYVADNLEKLTWQDLRVRQFVYEAAALPWAMTGVVDENARRTSTFGYDSDGRATSTEHAGGVGRYSVAYEQPPAVVIADTYDATVNVMLRSRSWRAPINPVMSQPNGASSALAVTLVQGLPYAAGRSQPAGAGCDASSSSLTYDANGNATSRTDFNGSKSCYANDLSRNLETVRIDGLGGSDLCPGDLSTYTALGATQRKTSTQWHPDWSLRTVVAEPKKLTTYVYNGQPDPFNGDAVATCAPANAVLPDGKPIVVLCKSVEQATNDADGRMGFAPGDPLYGRVSALLHLDGANGSTAITDKAAGTHTWVTTGSATLSTAQARFGGSSFQSGNGAAMTGAVEDFLFGSVDFTVETWVYKTSAPTNDAAIAALWAPNQYSWFMGGNASNQLTFYYSSNGGGGTAFPTAGFIPNNAWTHVAVSRFGASLLFFINGSQVGTSSISGSMFPSSGISVTVGAQSNLINQWPGYIDEVRVTKGVARYTSSFNLPATPFSDSVDGSSASLSAPSRILTYTYNKFGQTLTARNPLNKLTAYAYYSDTTDQHTMGDLQSVTDSAGRVTQYTRYDKGGRVLQSIDANGTVTDTTFTPRGWVKTVTATAPGATAQLTVYDYDGVGQLKKATLPDGSALEYTYDAAHRLTSVKDIAGNSVTYTLDNMGNRTGEDIKDPSGTLARNITRVYDALNRAQSATGARQ